MLPRGVNQVGLDGQIIIEEFRGARRVGLNPADLCRGYEHVFRAMLGEEACDASLIPEVQFGAGSRKQVLVATLYQASQDGGTHQSTVTGDIDPARLRESLRHGLSPAARCDGPLASKSVPEGRVQRHPRSCNAPTPRSEFRASSRAIRASSMHPRADDPLP